MSRVAIGSVDEIRLLVNQAKEAVQKLDYLTKAIQINDDSISIAAPQGGKLVGGTKDVFTWDAQGNITMSGKVQVSGFDLQTTLDNKQPKGDYVLNVDYATFKKSTDDTLINLQPKGDYVLAPDYNKFKTNMGEVLKRLPFNGNIKGQNVINFGSDQVKETNAGKIGYGTFDGGVNGTLNIVGAGKNGQSRQVQVWDSLKTTQALGVGADMPREWTGANFKRRDGKWTHFDWLADGKNYIRGNTIVDDDTSFGKNVDIGGNLTVKGKPILSPPKCVQKTTVANDWGSGNSIYLDRHNVQCDTNQILSGFQLFRPKPNQIAYKYTCCSYH